MITIKSKKQIDGIRESCHLLAQLLDFLEDGYLVEGMTTLDIDNYCLDYVKKVGGKPAFRDYGGFPNTACISVNDEIIHGVPSKNRIIKNGDLVSIDMGINLNGYFSDSARTIIVGSHGSEEDEKLCRVTREALILGCEAAGKKGARIHDIGRAVYNHCNKEGYGVVRDYCGHGVGLDVHEEPEVPNYVSRLTPNIRLRAGMVIAIEPMINLGTARILDNDPNGWTVRTADGRKSAHFEHTVAILDDGMEILTRV